MWNNMFQLYIMVCIKNKLYFRVYLLCAWLPCKILYICCVHIDNVYKGTNTWRQLREYDVANDGWVDKIILCKA